MASSITQAQVVVDWFNFPGGVGIVVDVADNSYTANWDYNPAGDITVTKRDAAGTILWEESYDNTDPNRHEVATWVEVDNAGNIIVSGTIRSGFSNPVNAASLLMKFSPAGTLLWRVVYENSFDGSSTRKCLVDSDDNIYVLGIGSGPNGLVTKVKKFNTAGTPLWNYFDSGIGAPITFKFTRDNDIVISHRSITGILNGFSKIDLDGNNIWSVSGLSSDTIGDIAGDGLGNTYIINGAIPGSELKKLSPTGTVVWTQPIAAKGNKVEVGSDNNPVVVGYPIGSFGVVVVKFDSNGNIMWENLDADGASLSLLALAPMKLDNFNNVYVAGSTLSEMGMCSVSNNGMSAWAVTTPSGYPAFFVFGSGNSIYLTGGTTAKITQSILGNMPVVETNLNFKMYPNPTSSTTYIEFNFKEPRNVQVTVFDVLGKIVTQIPMQELKSGINKINIDLSSLKNGLYFFQINTNNKLQIMKLIKY